MSSDTTHLIVVVGGAVVTALLLAAVLVTALYRRLGLDGRTTGSFTTGKPLHLPLSGSRPLPKALLRTLGVTSGWITAIPDSYLPRTKLNGFDMTRWLYIAQSADGWHFGLLTTFAQSTNEDRNQISARFGDWTLDIPDGWLPTRCSSHRYDRATTRANLRTFGISLPPSASERELAARLVHLTSCPFTIARPLWSTSLSGDPLKEALVEADRKWTDMLGHVVGRLLADLPDEDRQAELVMLALGNHPAQPVILRSLHRTVSSPDPRTFELPDDLDGVCTCADCDDLQHLGSAHAAIQHHRATPRTAHTP